MKIYNKLVIDMSTGAVLEEDSFEYDGPLMLAGGGPSQQQKDAATAQANLENQEAAAANKAEAYNEQQRNLITPFALSRMQGGNPYTAMQLDQNSGATAQAFAPAQKQLTQSLAMFGSSLPSGFATQAQTDLNSQRAQAYDSNMMNTLNNDEATRWNAVNGITGQQTIANPAAFYGAAGQANNSIMQAPLQSPGIAGILGGLGGAALGAAGQAGGFGKLFGCWIAESVFGKDSPDTHLVRLYLNTEFRKKKFGDLTMRVYLKFGERVATVLNRLPALKVVFRPLFGIALRSAAGWAQG